MELTRLMKPAAATLLALLSGCAAAAQPGGPHSPHQLPMEDPPPCGANGQPCCTDGRPTCSEGLTCQDNACRPPPPPPCGGEGQACCTDGRPACTDPLTCQNNVCAAPVRITATAVEINQTIEFEFDRAVIRAESHGILDQVASALRNHPEIRRVRVEGNTDQRGGARHNQRLSADRAAAVVTYLQQHGVTTTLTSEGYGSSRPLCREATEECHQRNRRVAFTILERAPAEGSAAPPAAGTGPAAPAPTSGSAAPATATPAATP